jgi:predicted component of type VI protein secretion system
MNIRTLAMGVAALVLFGCASNQQAVDRSLGQAEMTQAVAAESNVNAASVAKAKADLDSAQTLAANGDEEEAVVMADMSTLEYKLAIYAAERDEMKKKDEALEKELREDNERKAKYQTILNNEVKGGK